MYLVIREGGHRNVDLIGIFDKEHRITGRGCGRCDGGYNRSRTREAAGDETIYVKVVVPRHAKGL